MEVEKVWHSIFLIIITVNIEYHMLAVKYESMIFSIGENVGLRRIAILC